VGKLAEHAEEAFSHLDNGDLVGFTKRIIDIADYSVQSKKHRKAFDEFVEEHFKLREDLVEHINNLARRTEDGSEARGPTSDAAPLGSGNAESKRGTESSLEDSSVSRLQERNTKRGRSRPPKRERLQK